MAPPLRGVSLPLSMLLPSFILLRPRGALFEGGP